MSQIGASSKYKQLSIATGQQMPQIQKTENALIPQPIMNNSRPLPPASNTPYRFNHFPSYIDFMTQRVGRIDTGQILNDFKQSTNTNNNSIANITNANNNKPHNSNITKGGNFSKYKEMSDSTRLNDVYVKKFRKMTDIVQLVKESQCERRSDKAVERFVTKNFSFLSFIYNSSHNQFWLQPIQSSSISESIYIPAIQQYSTVSLDIKGQTGTFIILEYNQHKSNTDLMMIYSIDNDFYEQFERKTQLWDIKMDKYDGMQNFFESKLSKSQQEIYEQVINNHTHNDSDYTNFAITPRENKGIKDLSSIKKGSPMGEKDMINDFEQTLNNINIGSQEKKRKALGDDNYLTFNESANKEPNKDESADINESPLKQYLNQQQSSQQLYYEPKNNNNMPENKIESFDEQQQEDINDEIKEDDQDKVNTITEEQQQQEVVKELLSQEVLKSTLTTGLICVKYGQNTLFNGDKRLIQIDEALEQLTWKQNSKNAKVQNSLEVQNIFKIVHGRKTVNFKRFKTSDKKKNQLSFSIIFQRRSVDLQALTLDEKDKFLEALEQLLTQKLIKYSVIHDQNVV